MTAGPLSGAVPRSRAILWLAQWFAVIVVPGWLVWGTSVIAGAGGSYFLVAVFAAPLLVVLLLIAAILSVGIRTARRARGGPWYVWLLVAVWICVGVQPFLLESESTSGSGPSALERLGFPASADHSLVSFFFWAAAVLLALAWISTGAAGYAPPWGDGSDRKELQRQQRLTDRLDQLNSWRPDVDPPDGSTRAAPGADSRN